MLKNFDWSLYLVTDEIILKDRSFSEVIIKAVKGGVTAVQIRHKTASNAEFLELTKSIVKLLSQTPIPVIVNDRTELVIETGADGLHVGQSDLAFESARQTLPLQNKIGVSIENPEQLEKYKSIEPDYYGVGPVYSTFTKKDAAKPLGLDNIIQLRKQTFRPLIAIGGINEKNAASVLNTGADGLAVVSAICGANDPQEAAAKFSEIINLNKKHSINLL